MMIFTEFGRRVRDNGTGADPGAGGGAFIIGDNVEGGMYRTYPSLKPEDLNQGDLAPNYDFRGFYSSVIDQWLGLDPVPIVGGNFEQMSFVYPCRILITSPEIGYADHRRRRPGL